MVDSTVPVVSTEPLELAARMIELAEAARAEQADAVTVSSANASTTVRLQQLEKVSESTSRSVGLRVLLGGRQATVSTSDVSDGVLRDAVRTAIDLARISEPDLFAGLADPGAQSCRAPQLSLFDGRIHNSGGATFSTNVSNFALVDSNGFAGAYADISASIWVEVMAQEADGRMCNASWSSSDRALHRGSMLLMMWSARLPHRRCGSWARPRRTRVRGSSSGTSNGGRSGERRRARDVPRSLQIADMRRSRRRC